ncbi:hypothetical protein ACIPYQ_03355 [Streptomyces sp. NPDC090045]|uniref:hypothetical protein n=1 Tax=Streptomyces sp. NPDC090045 TaxID=3365927 RepID=UPI0037F781C5
MHTTFFRRLTLWGQRVAESEKGGEALDLAGIPPDPQRAALFGRRFSVATYGLLIDSRGPSDDEETLRIEMANEILHGMSDDARVERYRLLQDAVNSLATGLLTMATSYLGFGQSIEDALALSGATFALAASVITVRHLGSPAMSEKAQEARRQARNWLFSLHAWMVGYVLWGRGAVQRGEYEGIDQLAYIVRCLATHDAEIPDLPRDPDIQEDLVLLIENSERAGDTELTAALMRLQGVLRWRSEHLGSAIGNLIAIVQNIPDFGEEISPPIMLTAGEPDRPELPPPRREATPDEEPRPGIPPSRTE